MIFNDIGFAMLVTTLMILVLIGGVIITVFVANKKHIQQEVHIAQIQVNYEKELRTVENEVQEQTLNNISRELHDNIGQLLTLMRIQLEQEKIDRPDIIKTLAPLDNTLTDTIQQVRLLSHSLNHEVLEQNGLLTMVQQEVTRLKHFKKLTVHLEIEEQEPDLNKDERIMTFRIFQEILNNTLKHSAAKNIYVTLKTQSNFSLSVKDDGKGFDLQGLMRSGKGAGLINMKKRAALAHMSFNIDTTEGKGSNFTLSKINL